MTLPDLFEQRLVVDWWEPEESRGRATFVLRPAAMNACAGEESPLDPRGRCVFFTAGRCDIHDAKPSECRALTDDDTRAEIKLRRRLLVREWSAHQGQIGALLGRAPVAEKGSLWPW